MTEIQNTKQLGLILFEIWILQFGIYLQFGACNLLFPLYPDLDLCRVLSDSMLWESEVSYKYGVQGYLQSVQCPLLFNHWTLNLWTLTHIATHFYALRYNDNSTGSSER